MDFKGTRSSASLSSAFLTFYFGRSGSTVSVPGVRAQTASPLPPQPSKMWHFETCWASGASWAPLGAS